ncbi:MAG: conjugal transfer protein TraD [bacterium]|nr:conjugal transfer protein TraD [bacterium]
MEKKLNTSPADLRRKRTRTMIQLGGLFEKANLLEDFGLKPGDDLQDDSEIQESVAELFGALLEIKSMIKNNDHSPALWKQKGKKALSS